MCINQSACDRFGGERQNKSTRRRRQRMRRLENRSCRKQIDMEMKTTKLRQRKSLLAVQFYFLPSPVSQPMMAHFLTSYLPFSRRPHWTWDKTLRISEQIPISFTFHSWMITQPPNYAEHRFMLFMLCRSNLDWFRPGASFKCSIGISTFTTVSTF